jgi:hypothetical protein
MLLFVTGGTIKACLKVVRPHCYSMEMFSTLLAFPCDCFGSSICIGHFPAEYGDLAKVQLLVHRRWALQLRCRMVLRRLLVEVYCCRVLE